MDVTKSVRAWRTPDNAIFSTKKEAQTYWKEQTLRNNLSEIFALSDLNIKEKEINRVIDIILHQKDEVKGVLNGKSLDELGIIVFPF